MPIPGLSDIYEFGEWLKREYIGMKRKPLAITPVQGGLIQVTEEEPKDDNARGDTND